MLIAGFVAPVMGFVATQSDQPARELMVSGAVETFSGFLRWKRLRARSPRRARFSLLTRNKSCQEGQSDHRWENGYYE
ncbi:MAG TPA: hypothetical protein PLE10_09590 [Brevefilum sp.]|nr:hypothetical protein [Brevefilum sp.]HOR20059.1 hypothetical protein [Brevefilum sp.]HPL69270.1 hypothetical protein [Brevefilum sp.]